MSHELGRWREHFPILAHTTYLASHSLGAVPQATLARLETYFEEWAELGIRAWDGPWWAAVEELSQTVGGLIGAPPATVVPMLNVSRGMAAVASCLDFGGRRNRIVLTALEFTTSYPVWRGCEALGAELVIVPSDDGLSVPVGRIVEAIDERTVIAPLSHAYFRSGALQDLAAVTEAAHRHGALVLGDGYQVVGCVPVDVQALDVDFYVGGCHKWLCGGPGAGWLYVRRELAETLRPRLTGWFGLADPFGYAPGTGQSAPAAGVMRFLDGTPNVPGLYAALPGVDVVATIGVEAIRAVSERLTERIVAEADARGLTLKSPRDVRARNGMVCLSFPGDREAVAALAARDIIVDWRPDCGMRISPHFYNSEADLEVLFQALDEHAKGL